MKLLLRPLTPELRQQYSNHSHYNQGDSGLDLFFPEDVVIPANQFGFMVDLQIQSEALRNDNNTSGEIVKVILGSGKVAEGLDFKRVREIHILEPWYNLNKIEQVVGRGIRFCSHQKLIKEKRNVTVYLHVCFTKEIETADIELYKVAENKAIEIGNIEHVLKENAVDCYINNDINHI